MAQINQIAVPAGTDHRPIRGMEIAAVARIDRDGNYYLVPSQSGQPRYKVWYNEDQPSCNCPDFETRGCKCKHIWAVQYTLQKNAKGTFLNTPDDQLGMSPLAFLALAA
jgi:hypothetical protein